MENFTLELLHIADQEAGAAAVRDAPNLSAVLNALRAEDLGADGVADNTLTLSSGDAFIPGLFFEASGPVFGAGGVADIQIQNELGVQAIALGNHEFDFGTRTLQELITGQDVTDDSDPEDGFVDTVPRSIAQILGADFTGAEFPYLSTNLDFSTDANLAPLAVAGGQGPQAATLSSSVVIDVNGEPIAVVGATTPTLDVIASPGDVTILPDPFDGAPSDAQLDALAAEIQAEVDALLAGDPDLDKVVLLAHFQQIDIELAVAERLTDVDVIVAGGSNTRLFDADDRPRDGDSDQGVYPQFVTNAGGATTAVVNTDGGYKYVGRLVIDFDDNGEIIPESYDPAVSGSYATDAQGVADLGAEGLVDPEVQQIADAIGAQIVATESNVFGNASVFLNGNRTGAGTADDPDGVRSQETNLGNLTADANLAEARKSDPSVLVSIKNGGGIRASIGETLVPPGGQEAVRSANAEVVDAEGAVVKPAGGISQNDIANALSFNNGLALLTLTKEELLAVIEHGVGDIGAGRFIQVSGVAFSFDPDQPAGARVVDAAVVDETGSVVAEIARGGEIAGDPTETFRIVTLNFLADGGDGYPFPAPDAPAADRVDLFQDLDGDGRVDADGPVGGDAVFAPNGSEQDALAEYLDDNFADAATAFDQADTGPAFDARVQNLAFRDGDVLPFAPPIDPALAPTEPTGALTFEAISAFAGTGAEINALAGPELFVTNSEADQVDVFDIVANDRLGEFPLAGVPNYAPGGVTSVASSGDAIAIAFDGLDGNGGVLALSAESAQLFEVGNLPDAVTFSPDGTKIVVSNEGEFDSDESVDPMGSISVIDISAGIENGVVSSVDFTQFDGQEDALRAQGVRIFPDRAASVDLEPEFATVTPDGRFAVVTLQENNALALVDISGDAPVIVDLLPLGVVDHAQPGAGLDPNDRDDAIAVQNAEVDGLRLPDAIASYEVGGRTYVVVANEGDDRGDFDEPENGPLGDAARVGDILDGEVPGVSIDPSVDTAGLERLTVSILDGDTDGDGDIDRLTAYGGRSVSIFDLDGALLYDSGDLFARVAAEFNRAEFQGNEGEFDTRSDNKGVEPEGLAIGEIDGRVYAFVALERDSGIATLDVTDPEDVAFVAYFNESDSAVGAVSPEGVTFVPAVDAPDGEPLLIVSYEETGDTVVYRIGSTLSAPGERVVASGLVEGGAGDDTLVGRGSDDTLVGSTGDDAIRGARGDDAGLGGAGDDLAAGGGGDDTLIGGQGDDTLRGQFGRDALEGGAGDDRLAGGARGDTLDGGEGADFLAGGRGWDRLEGGAGDDTLLGGGGEDTLVGGAGDDRMTGGFGRDRFEFLDADGGDDAIIGFQTGFDTLAFDAGLGLSAESLVVDQVGGDAVVSYGAGARVTLVNVSAAKLEAEGLFDFG